MKKELFQKNIILCGVGGQGTILASRLMADAAMRKGLEVKTAETIGMAQRGGSVFSHMKIGGNLHSPLIGNGEADLILSFEPAETIRHLPFLKKGGQVIASSQPVMPVSAMIGAAPYPAEEILQYLQKYVPNLTLIDAARAAEDLGSSKVLNVVLLGAAARSGALGLTPEELREAIAARVPERFHELNFRALMWE